VTTPETTVHPYDGGITRTILGWLDDDDFVAPADVVGGGAASSEALALNQALVPFAADIVGSPHRAGDSTELAAEVAARTRDHILQHNSALAGIWARTLTAHNFMLFDGGAVSSRERSSGAEPIRAYVAPSAAIETLRRHCDFHSSSVSALADITFTIESVLSDWRKVFSTDLGDDSEPTAYTDDAGDYPPLARNYVDVKVRIHGDEKVKPRRYTDEDHQVWRT
jgi:hypothetical protein